MNCIATCVGIIYKILVFIEVSLKAVQNSQNALKDDHQNRHHLHYHLPHYGTTCYDCYDCHDARRRTTPPGDNHGG